jgi:HAMP domain-containing protein
LSSSSVRIRLFLVIAGMALLASLSIAAVYVATEAERLDVRDDAAVVASQYDLTVRLSTTIRDQEAAIDDYLLAGSASAIVRYHDAVENELRLAERMRLVATQVPDIPDIQPALRALEKETATWRGQFAGPAIAAVDRGSNAEIAKIAATAGADQQTTVSTVGRLVARIADGQISVAARDDSLTWTRGIAVTLGVVLMLFAAGASLLLARRWITNPLSRLVATATEVEGGADLAFVTERNDEIGKLGDALEGMRSTLQQDANRSNILNRFTEVTTFAPDDTAVAAASLEALRLLVQPDAAVSHVLNRSKDRAVPEATIGSAIAEVLPLNALSGCPGIVRGSIYVTPDAGAPLSVRCPIYPLDHGTLACVPLAHGETVGAVHLFWERRDGFGLDLRAAWRGWQSMRPWRSRTAASSLHSRGWPTPTHGQALPIPGRSTRGSRMSSTRERRVKLSPS